MKKNYVCAMGCGYSTNVKEAVTVEELNKIVERDGGFVTKPKSCCPKCKENSLVFSCEE